MSDAQTEARAIARLEYVHGSEGYALRPDAGGRYVLYTDHATALAAKDVELAEMHQRYVDANEARIDAEAQLAEHTDADGYPYAFDAPESQQEAARIGDAVLDWMTKYDLLDGEQEYYVADVIAVLDDLTPLARPAEQAVTGAMVEAAREIIHGARHVYSDEDLAAAALKAAMEAGR